MEALVPLLFFLLFSIVGSLLKNQQSRLPPPPEHEGGWEPAGPVGGTLPGTGGDPWAGWPGEDRPAPVVVRRQGEIELDQGADFELLPLDEEDAVPPFEAVTLEPVTPEQAESERWKLAMAAPPPRGRSLERDVDRRKEHARFHQQITEPVPSAPATRGTLDELRDPAALRRAILMAEVFGPPRALRGWEEDLPQ